MVQQMAECEVFYAKYNHTHVLKLVGDIRLRSSKPLEDFYKFYLNDLINTADTSIQLIIDATEVTGLDSTALGLLAQIAIRFNEKTQEKPGLVCISKSIQKIITAVNFNELFWVINKAELPLATLKLIEKEIQETETETEIAARALQAHRILMSLSEANKQQFLPVVKFLEQELKK